MKDAKVIERFNKALDKLYAEHRIDVFFPEDTKIELRVYGDDFWTPKKTVHVAAGAGDSWVDAE